MNHHLVSRFNDIWQKALTNSPLAQKSAVCISTIDEEGFPHSRFVDLKSVDEHGFTFCTAYDSKKGLHLLRNPKVSLVAWWDHIGCQIRVVGKASPISDSLADQYWNTRSREAKVATTCFEQSVVAESECKVVKEFEIALSNAPSLIPRPLNWGGFIVSPTSIEFLSFQENRVHKREIFELSESGWQKQILQP